MAARREPGLVVVEAAALAHRGQGGGQAAPGRGGVADVVGGDDLDPGAQGHVDQGVVAGGVDGVAVVPDLDPDVLGPERGHELLEPAPGRGRALGHEGGGDACRRPRR